MYIFKNPRIGGEVEPHKDSTFLITDPLSVCGIWVALDAATVDNGCMWGVPGSHKSDPNVYMRKRKNEDGQMETYMDPEKPHPYDTANAVPLEVEAGSIVLLHGSFLHWSKANISGQQRHAYVVHCVEREQGYEYSTDTWIQRTKPEHCEGV